MSFYFKRRGAFDTSFLKGKAAAPRTVCEPLFGRDVLAAKDPPMMGRTDQGSVANVEGALQAMRDQALAKAQGSGATTIVTGADGQPYQQAAGGHLTAMPQNPAPFNEVQGKAAGFADRMRRAASVLDQTEGAGLDAQGRLLENFGIAGNYLQDPKYRQYQQARDDLIAAQLRRESGAAIHTDEYTTAYQRYMPRPGDDAATLAQKRAARQTLLEGMTREAGPQYKPSDAAAPAAGGDDLLKQARDAIAKGAPRDKVLERLKSMGGDPGKL